MPPTSPPSPPPSTEQEFSENQTQMVFPKVFLLFEQSPQLIHGVKFGQSHPHSQHSRKLTSISDGSDAPMEIFKADNSQPTGIQVFC